MAGDYIPANPTKAPETIATDLVGALSKMTEAAREASLPGGTVPAPEHSSSPYYQHPQWPQQFPSQQYPSQGFGHSEYNSTSDYGSAKNGSANLTDELQGQLDAKLGTSIRNRKAASEDLDDVVSKVNSGLLADGLTLKAIDNPYKLAIENAKGGQDHSNITIDLNTGVISDQSGTRYVAKEEKDRVGLIPVEPATVKSYNNIGATYDAKDQLTKVVLPDGTTLLRDVTAFSQLGPPTFSINDSSGKQIGTAQNLNYDGRTLMYKTDGGQSLVALNGNRMITANQVTGEMRSKIASEAGIALPSADPAQQFEDAQILTRGAIAAGIPFTAPRVTIPTAHQRYTREI